MPLKPPVSKEDHAQGPDEAAVTLVEYGDYQCPHCGAAYPVVKRLQKHYGDRLRFVFRNFPLSQGHALAQPAAEVAEFASVHGKFWEIHDAIYEHQSQLSLATLQQLAAEAGLDPDVLAHAMQEGTYAARVKHDFTSGVRSGVNGTPTFFINGVRHDDYPDYPSLVAAIDAVL